MIGYLVGSVNAARQAVLAGRCRFGGGVGGVLDTHLVLLNVLHRKLDPRGVTTNHFFFLFQGQTRAGVVTKEVATGSRGL